MRLTILPLLLVVLSGPASAKPATDKSSTTEKATPAKVKEVKADASWLVDSIQNMMSRPGAWSARFAESYRLEQKLYEKRVAAGHQPELPFTSGQFLASAAGSYLVFTWILHVYMTKRAAPFSCKPFKSILLVYNFICVLLAGYVVWGILYVLASVPERKFVCNTLQTADAAGEKYHASFLAHVFWVFYAQKFWEFLDTWFFLLRKSFRQVTFLHVFHHCSICLVVGLIIPFEFNGDMYLPILLNAGVHVLMYSHYLVSALGLSTPWKPYLTSMQLLQFVTIAVQNAISLSRGSACGSSPYFAKVLMVAYMGSMLILFGNFFFQTYILKKPTRFGGGVVKKMEPLQITKQHSGRTVLDSRGEAVVELPSSFEGGELTYQVTPIGRAMPNLHVSDEHQNEHACGFSLAGGVPDKPVSYTVTMVLTLLGEKPKPKLMSCCDTDGAQDSAWCCLNSASMAPETGRSGTPRGGSKKIR